ncbi:MAG: hypothetical protein R2864_08610 [Syntrophotaleaceae bacterium]
MLNAFSFEEFDARFNLVAVDYLIYPTEVLVNIWESYPVVWILLAVAGVALLLHRLTWPILRRGLQSSCPIRLRLGLGGLWLLLATSVVLLPGIGAPSVDRVATELAANGLCSLVRAFRSNELNYDQYYRTLETEQAFSLMRQELALPETAVASRDLNRTRPARTDGIRAP